MKKINQATWTLILVCVVLFAGNILLGVVLIRESISAIRTQIESRMLDVANTAAAMLDGDVLESLQAEDADTPEYQAALKILSKYEENIELAYIYCVRDMGDRTFAFMIDPDPESPGSFGDHIPYTDALFEASLGTPAVDKEPYADQWGRFYSAYSPVFNSRHEVGGIVAVDFSAEWLEQQISGQVIKTLEISGFSLFVAALIIFLITSRYRKRLRLLYHEMNLVSDGIETLVREATPGAATVDWQPEEEEAGDEIKALGNKIHSLQHLLSEQIAQVRSQAYIDGLTRLGNRVAYEEQVRQLDAQIQAGMAEFAIAVFDLNGLKEINDRLGHEKGDQAIRQAADALKMVFPDAKPYRIGGDEFIVIREGPVDALRSRLGELREGKIDVSMSQGSAAYEALADQSFQAVFNRADAAMYENKKKYYQSHTDRRRR